MKTKVSVSLPRDLLEEIDDEAAQTSRSRSHILEVWLRLAAQANQAAGRLAEGFARLPGVRLIQPVQANEVFAAFPPGLFAALTDAGFGFHEWPAPPGVAGDVVRLVTSYATTGADVQALLDAAARFA